MGVQLICFLAVLATLIILSRAMRGSPIAKPAG
jgi:hypothetical protein